MLREELVFVGTCDVAGHVRGKGFPAREIESRRRKGVGWTHPNLMQTAFGPIWDTPFGTGGDLMIVPDPAAEVRVDIGDGGLLPEGGVPGCRPRRGPSSDLGHAEAARLCPVRAVVLARSISL